MHAFLAQADDVLRRRPWTTQSGNARRALTLLAADIIVFGMLYGAVMGSFGGLAPQRVLQVLYAAIKVPMLLSVTFVIALPSFFVLNTLFGLRRDFGQAVRALVAAQAGLAIVLAGLAPLTLFWYAGFADYAAAVRFNLLMFAGASFAAQGLLRAYYQPLVERNKRHRWILWTWLAIYAFVGVQMAWICRPFVAAPGQPVQFFRPEAWDNAYVIVGKLLYSMFAR